MGGQIVPKRFGLKYSPKPAIALEYQKPDSGLAILEVVLEELSPETYNVEGVVDTLQKNHPSHLGPNMVSANQLERLVSRLLFEGRAHLPEGYPTPTGMIVEDPVPSPLSHEPPTKPPPLPKAEELSGSRSSGPTPLPTPEVQRATRDRSDGSSATSETQSPRGNGFDDVGAEETERFGAAVNASAVQQQASSDNGEEPHLPAAVAANASAAPLLVGEDVRGWDDDEEEEEEDDEEEKKSRGEGDEEGAARERERKESEHTRGGGGGGARDGTKEESRGDAKGPPSLVGTSSLPDVGHEQHGKLEKEGEDVHDHDQPADDGVEGYGRYGKAENKVEPLSTPLKSFITAAETTSKPNEEAPDREKSPGDSYPGENDDTGKEKPRQGQEGEEETSEEEEIPEIEEEDDDIPEDVESEEMYETGGIHAADKDDEGEADDGDDQLRSKEDGSKREADGTDDNGTNPSTPSREAGVAVGRMGAVNREEDHPEEDERASPRTIAGEARRLGTPTPPPLASSLKPPPTPTSPAAPGTTPPSQGASEERDSLSPSSSPLAPSRDLAPAGPSSPGAGAGIGASPLGGLPLPPMGGARQRLGLLGSLPPVGGRGLPSLALPVGKKTVGARPEGESDGGVRRAGAGGTEDDANKGATGATDTPVSGGASPLLLSPSSLSATRSSIAGKGDPVAASAPSCRPSQTAGSAREKASDEEIAAKDDGDDSRGGLHELARLAPTRGDEKRGGKGEKEQEEEEEAALRARLGFGRDEDEGEGEDEKEGKDGDEGGGDESSSSRGRTRNVLSPSPGGSPRQHQGQEEENAGRVSPPNPRSEEGRGATPTGSGAGGDYFGDLDEVSSVDEDLSFEDESVDGDGGDGDGTGSDDYFS